MRALVRAMVIGWLEGLAAAWARLFQTRIMSKWYLEVLGSVAPFVHEASRERGKGCVVVRVMCVQYIGCDVTHRRCGDPPFWCVLLGRSRMVAVAVVCAWCADHSAQRRALS